MKQWRCYVIGYKQEWADENMALCQKLIEGADFCADAPEGIPIGLRFNTWILHGGQGQAVPTDLVCIAHEHGGKIAIVQQPTAGSV